MIIITGAEGFIGSVLVERLIERGYNDLLCVDLEGVKSNGYLASYPFLKKINHNSLSNFIDKNHRFIEFVFHMGACSDTTADDPLMFDELNLEYTKKLWHLSVKYGIPFLYASSAATYGDGSHGYSDTHALTYGLQPLNLYGQSKHDFDIWALKQSIQPQYWAGLKFFNVFGHNEAHKKSMASVVLHAFNQINKQGYVNLFRSHRSDVGDGEQSRDFVYVEDVCSVMIDFMERMPENGIFNVGTGINRSFKDLVNATFAALNLQPSIKYIDTPINIRKQYQYFTKGDISKLRRAGYTKEFRSLEDSVADYVKNYLMKVSNIAV